MKGFKEFLSSGFCRRSCVEKTILLGCNLFLQLPIPQLFLRLVAPEVLQGLSTFGRGAKLRQRELKASWAGSGASPRCLRTETQQTCAAMPRSSRFRVLIMRLGAGL